MSQSKSRRMEKRSTMRHSYGCRSNSILVFLALVLLLPNDRFQAHADADLQDNEDLSEYLYLKERKSDVYPIDEYKKSSPTVVDKTHPDHPDFLYSSNYPHHRIVEFYAHWCPHCKRFKPNYINFARSLQEFLVTSKLENVTIETRAVSCVPNQQICKDMEIHSYPTVKFFPAFSMNGTTAHIYDLHPLQTLRVFQLYQEQPANITESTKTEPDAKTFNLRNHFKRPLKTTQLVFMDRTQQEIYNDAHLSFAFALKTAIFMGNGPGQPLDPSPQMHFQDFLRILQNGLPPSMSLQPLLADLLDPFEFVVMSDDHLQEVLGRHPAPATEWSPSCLKHDSGYTCGLWQLFHIMSIGIVEWNQLVPIASSEDLILPPMGVADALRNYISDFFGCDDCRTHFLKEYDACHHDRCNRLIDHRAGGTRSDWIELPLWLFEMHNGVNSRLRNERIADYQDNNGGNKEETTEQDVLWPPKEKCPRCWLSDGRWDEQMVYLYMRLEYWPEDGESQEFRRKLLNPLDATENNNKAKSRTRKQDEGIKTAGIPSLVQGGQEEKKQVASAHHRRLLPSTQETMIKWGLVPLMVFLVVGWRVWSKKQTFVRKGLHKKHESDLA